MKKYLKILILGFVGVLFSQESFAQWFVTGEFDLSSQNDYSTDTVTSPDYKTRERSFHLEGGYYFNDRFALGAGIGMGYRSTEDFRPEHKFSSERTSQLYLFLRYDFLHNDKIQLGAKTELGINNDIPDIAYRVVVRPVLNYKFNDHWAATTSFGSIGYTYSKKEDSESSYRSHRWNTSLLFSNISLGVVYTF